jgi:hypothetical protein
MLYEGVLKKMRTEALNPIQYYLIMANGFLNVNQALGQKLTLKFLHYECLNCHLDKPIYRQGFCQSCFFETAQAGDWIIKPELSKAHLNQEDRDLEFEKKMQLQPHIVYLANSSNVKVGVTRKAQIPTRWVDQGAHEALIISETPNRYLAGITEVALKEFVSDKTSWRKMLTNDIEDVDLLEWKEKLVQHIPEEAKEFVVPNGEETHLHFPVLQYPTKVNSLNLEKKLEYEGILKGIKGQYLIFEDNTVFNIRGNEGLFVSISVN